MNTAFGYCFGESVYEHCFSMLLWGVGISTLLLHSVLQVPVEQCFGFLTPIHPRFEEMSYVLLFLEEHCFLMLCGRVSIETLLFDVDLQVPAKDWFLTAIHPVLMEWAVFCCFRKSTAFFFYKLSEVCTPTLLFHTIFTTM